MRICAAALLSLAVAEAQFAISARAGLVDFVEGAAFIDGTPVVLSYSFLHLRERQRLSTTQGARVQMLLGPNMYLWLGEQASLTLNNSKLDEAEVTFESGEAIVEVTEEIKGNKARLRIGQSIIAMSKRGVYRFDTQESSLRVYGGEAEVSSPGARKAVKRNNAVRLDPGLKDIKFVPKETDAFQFWAAYRSFAVFEPHWRELNGKNWHISLTGTAHNDSFGAEINSPPIVAEILRRQAEVQKVRAESALLDERVRQKREAELKRQQEADRRAQKEAAAAEAARKAQQQQKQ